MRIVVTGPNGFIARNFIREYGADNEIIGVVREGSALRADLKPFVKEVYEYDSSPYSLEAAFTGADGIVHLAAYFTNKSTIEEETKLYWDNTIFTGHIFQAVRNLSEEDRLTPVVSAQTWTAYDKNRNEAPANFYSATKLAGQYLSYGTNATFLVVPDTFGSDDTRPKIHNLVRKDVIKEFMSPLDQVMNLMHVKDVARAFITAVELGNSPRAVRSDSFDLLYSVNRVRLDEVASLLGKDVGSSNSNEISEILEGKFFIPGFEPRFPVREYLGVELAG